MNTKNIFMEENKSTIISMYEDKRFSVRKVAKLLGVSRETITAYLGLWGINLNKRGWVLDFGYNKRFSCDNAFFSHPNPYNSYWAGFIAADGNITKYNSVRIGIKSTDEIILHNLQKASNYTGRIKKYEYSQIPNRYYSVLEIFSPQWVSDLERWWNITQRKSKTLLPPVFNLGEKCTCSFIVGYLDGDGSISRKNKVVQICGTYPMLSWIRASLLTYVNGFDISNGINPSKSIYSLRFQGQNASKFFAWAINNYDGFRLKRKWRNI